MARKRTKRAARPAVYAVAGLPTAHPGNPSAVSGRSVYARRLSLLSKLQEGGFDGEDFNVLLRLMNVVEWLGGNKPKLIEPKVREQRELLREALTDLHVRWRRIGRYAAGPELMALRGSVMWLSEWLDTLPAAVVGRAEDGVDQYYIRKAAKA